MDDRITVSIVTRDRPAALLRAVRSLARLGERMKEAVVWDDGSDPPAGPALLAALGETPPWLRLVRSDGSEGMAAGRNAVVRGASTEWVLQLDDDALIVDPAAVDRAVAVLRRDPAVAAIALGQGDEAGRPWPHQPAPVARPCLVPAFIGYGAVLRRSAFLEAGGYRAAIGIFGEEKDLCLRWLEAGRSVVYLPDAVVGHVADPAGRDHATYVHRAVRNDVLAAVWNEPAWLLPVSVPVRLRRYFPMIGATPDAGGFPRLLRAVGAALPAVLRERRPVRWATLREWRRRGRDWPAYTPPDEA